MPSSGFQHSIVYQQPRQHARSICGHAQPCAWFTAHGAQQNLQKQPGSSYVGMITCLVCGERGGLRRERGLNFSRAPPLSEFRAACGQLGALRAQTAGVRKKRSGE